MDLTWHPEIDPALVREFLLAVLAEDGRPEVGPDGPLPREFAGAEHLVHADGALRLGELVIDEATYMARLRGRPLDLTYKEFELLKYLAQHAGRVFTRAQLLQEVWGYDFFGGTRTVDVHVRRLRAKLGTEHEQMIGTVRNVGYKFVQPPKSSVATEETSGETADVN